MGWQDAPLVEETKETPKEAPRTWEAAPLVEDQHSAEEYEAPKKKEESRLERMGRLYEESKKEQKLPSGIPSPTSIAKYAGEGLKPVGEAALSMATGMGASAAGGIRGLYGLATGESAEEAAKGVEETQRALTYEPRTAGGKLLTEAAAAPMEMASAELGKAGGAVGKFVGGAKGEAAGEEIGKATLPIAATLAGGAGALRAGRAAAARPREPIPGETYSPLREFTPEQRERFYRQKEQGLRPTLASVTRDPEQYRFEEQMSKTKAGDALHQAEVENNAAIIKHVEDTDKLRAGRPALQNKTEVGIAIGQALEDKANASKARINDLYNKARDAGETKMFVGAKNVQKFLNENKEEHASLDVMQRKLDRLKKANNGKLTVDDMETLYRTASDQTEYGTPSAVYMGRLKEAINKDTEGIGGDMYRAARAARLAHAMEFEERTAIADQVSKKTRTDYKVDAEDRFNKAVYGSSLEELKDITNSLLTTDPKTPEGARAFQAVREMQSQIIDDLSEAATRGIAQDTKGNVTFSPVSFRRAIDKIGKAKLDWMLGKDAIDRLQSILQSSIELKTSPGRIVGSETFSRFQTAAARAAKEEAAKHIISSVPGAKGVAEWWHKKQEAKRTQMQIEEAVTPHRASLEDIETGRVAAKKRERAYQMKEAAQMGKAAAPAGYVGMEEAEKPKESEPMQ